ncbi:hypothetical protein Pla163_30380 [Planctomycetes bacterium Pla163]|uniref:DUF6265 domain-containing protein n=1 Tax=Rohdeia mirabilis TaxID=2528008 RepID=A0A518D331_9BACT|nr:hypothetical protein Pla163_30380 [Planctomycetes bacterium Pla163]
MWTAARLALLVAAGLLAGCATPPRGLAASSDASGATGGPRSAPARTGQPTAPELAFLEGAWEQEREGAVRYWEVWRRTERGFEGSAWQATRGLSHRTERMELELTLEGWVLTPVLFDELEREYRSDPFPLTAWGDGWVRFENPAHERPHTIAYRRTGADRLEAWIVSREADGRTEKQAFRFSAMDLDGTETR